VRPPGDAIARSFIPSGRYGISTSGFSTGHMKP
jgi:hypothetical protein